MSKTSEGSSRTPEAEELAQIRDDFHAFISGFNSLILATVSADGLPESSYAPFIQLDGRFYIYISELASHTQNLLVKPVASLLLIEAEQDARNLFARKRATIQVHAQVISRDAEDWQRILDQMAEQLGDMIGLVRQLTDFHLFELQPQSAGFVVGFGKAYRLEGDGLAEVTLQQR
ncbi:HugZ family protein [Oceanobacter mangrovi]|uniref:HugZ family pyridoxamine 5'-phosphate oxidase n=1 Tax=Oceanobacter mangrovi TaxID=2862510 RepID=UPI001C8ED0C9|nr:pyridoxamine 5'-phosphate oxidase family protein [Oceanobacter mangrovi]